MKKNIISVLVVYSFLTASDVYHTGKLLNHEVCETIVKLVYKVAINIHISCREFLYDHNMILTWNLECFIIVA
jgi:hypothetical protein